MLWAAICWPISLLTDCPNSQFPLETTKVTTQPPPDTLFPPILLSVSDAKENYLLDGKQQGNKKLPEHIKTGNGGFRPRFQQHSMGFLPPGKAGGHADKIPELSEGEICPPNPSPFSNKAPRQSQRLGSAYTPKRGGRRTLKPVPRNAFFSWLTGYPNSS
jgi:hypothetical protein